MYMTSMRERPSILPALAALSILTGAGCETPKERERSNAQERTGKKKHARSEHARSERPPSLPDRMNNPAAITYAHYRTPQTVSEFVRVTLPQYGIEATRGERDNKGNYVAHFKTREEGLKAAAILLKRPSYRNLTVTEAIKRWAGSECPPDYLVYIARRTRLPMRGKILAALSDQDLRVLVQAITEYESGHPGRGSIEQSST